MEDLLIAVLETFGYPIRRQGSLLPDEPYPDSFFTFWCDSSDAGSFYDDDEVTIEWGYSLFFYSTDPSLVSRMLMEAKAALKAKGFIVAGGGYDVSSDEITHTGRGMDVYYLQKI